MTNLSAVYPAMILILFGALYLLYATYKNKYNSLIISLISLVTGLIIFIIGIFN